MPSIKIKKLHPDAVIPKQAHEGDAGFDLVSIDESFTLNHSERKVVATGLSVEIPFGYELQIRPRSGLAAKQGLTVLNAPGTVDASYRGELKVVLVNHDLDPQHIRKGERIAQAVINKIPEIEIEEVSELSETKRGDGGFGSTGR